MKRTPARIALATVMTASIGLGGAAAVQAAPKPVAAKSAKAFKSAKVDRRAAAEHRLVAAFKKDALREVARKAAALTAAEARIVKANLGATETAAVKDNIVLDQAVLADYRASIDAAKTRTAVATIDKALNAFRVENYDQVRGLLAAQNRASFKVGVVNAQIADVTTAVDAKAAKDGDDATDVVAARAALATAKAKAAEAAAPLAAADAKALTVRATTTRKGADSAVKVAHLALARASYSLLAAQKKVVEAKGLVSDGPIIEDNPNS